MHQLTSAFHTMSLCTRPLLVAGFKAAAGDEEPMLLDSSSTSLTPEQVRGLASCTNVLDFRLELMSSVLASADDAHASWAATFSAVLGPHTVLHTGHQSSATARQ